jgi:hypothetical protein
MFIKKYRNMKMQARIPIKIIIEKIGEFNGEFIRFYAPITIEYLLKNMPLEGFAGIMDYCIFFETKISIGAEKTINKVIPGDICYWPPRNAICLFFKEAIPPVQTVRIGKFFNNIENLVNTKQGSRIRILLK